MAGRLTVSPSYPLHHTFSPVKTYRVLNKYLCADRRCWTMDKIYKMVQHLCRCCILEMLQCLVEPINVGPHYTLSLGILSSLVPCPVGSINGHELLLEEQLKLLPS